MKKLTLFLMACAVAVMGFAQGGKITYVLNGGVTNPDGWENKADMLVGLNQDYNTFYEVAEDATWYTWETLEKIMTYDDPVVRIPTFATKMWGVIKTDKWLWLHDYIVATVAEQGIAEIGEAENAYWRYNVSAFFISGQRVGWPKSADYAVAGQPEAFMPAWKHGFAGPDTYDGTVEVVIPAPYKEGATFDGWYEAADFSGDRVTAIPVGATGDKTLYAKWVEYIPSIAEVWALEVDETTKTKGVVSIIIGNKVYIQDATGGMLLEFAAAPDVAVSDEIVVTAKVAANGTKKKLVDVAVKEKAEGTPPAIQKLTLAGLKADEAKEYATYIYEYVQFLGLIIESYKEDGTAIVADDAGNTILLVTKLDKANYPVETKIDFKGVVDFAEDVQLNTIVDNITKSPVPRPETFEYPAYEDGKYTLTSKWLVSAKMDNLGANPIGTPNYVRGMAAMDGKMYFVDRELEQLTVLDGATGKRLKPIKLAANMFTYTDTAGVEKPAGTLRFNDIKIDGAGNVLLGNCITSNKEMFQVWKVDLATGNGTLVVEEMLSENPDLGTSIRFDAFGVYGDVDGEAIIMASNANAMEAYKWTINDGVAGKAELIEIDTSVEGTYLTGLTNPGTAPQIFPLDMEYFYLDGNATLPTLIDMDGNVVDGFYNNVDVQTDSITNPEIIAKLNQGHNGLIEFELGGEYFFLIAASNTIGTPPSAFRLFKWKDAGKSFADMTSLWTFPSVGMGGQTNAYRTAVPSVEVDEDAGIAKLYVYTGENGYGMYEFKVNKPIDDNLKAVYNNDAVKLSLQDRTLVLDREVANISVYSVTGQLVATDAKVSRLDVNGRGIFLVKATTYEGETAVHKVIIK